MGFIVAAGSADSSQIGKAQFGYWLSQKEENGGSKLRLHTAFQR